MDMSAARISSPRWIDAGGRRLRRRRRGGERRPGARRGGAPASRRRPARRAAPRHQRLRGRGATPRERTQPHRGSHVEPRRPGVRQPRRALRRARLHPQGGPVRLDAGGTARLRFQREFSGDQQPMPNERANVKNEKQYEALKDKGMSKERAAKIANSPGASSRGGKKSGSGGSSSQGGTTAQKKAAGRKGGKAAAKKS